MRLLHYSFSVKSIQDKSVARFAPHTAFEGPTAPVDAAFRESLELRSLVFCNEVLKFEGSGSHDNFELVLRHGTIGNVLRMTRMWIRFCMSIDFQVCTHNRSFT